MRGWTGYYVQIWISTTSWNRVTREYVAIVRDVRSAGRWRDKLGYVFGPPGWEPAPVTAAS